MYPVVLSLVVFAAVLVAQFLLLRVWAVAGAPSTGGGIFNEVVAPSPVVRALSKLATPSDSGAVRGIHRDLVQAGFRGSGAFPIYLALRTVFAVVLPASLLYTVRTLGTVNAVGVLLGVAAVGYFLPVVVVRGLADARRRRIRGVFPNALDMLVNCLESGLGLDAALRYVARELTEVSPELTREFDMLNAELQAGISRTDALNHMRERNGVDAVDGLVSVIAQAERYGVGIADAMRSHAKMSRRRRILDAERRAAEAAPKLTVAMVLFVLPPLFIVLIGPTAIRLSTGVLPMLEGR
jgi:tight adherence protein C